jgi:hypothetical protein
MKAEETFGEGGYSYLGNGEYQPHGQMGGPPGQGAPCKLTRALGSGLADVQSLLSTLSRPLSSNTMEPPRDRDKGGIWKGGGQSDNQLFRPM